MIALSLWPRRFGNSYTWTKPFVQWPAAGSWTSVSVTMSTWMIPEWTYGYHAMFPLLRDTSQNPGCIGILMSYHYAHYTKILITGFVLLSRYCVPASPWQSHMCLARRWLMSSHQEVPKNISPLSEEQIPLSSYLATWWNFPMNL